MSIFVAGLDLAQMSDYTALAIEEASGTIGAHHYDTEDEEYGLPVERMANIEGPPVHHVVRHLERVRGLAYPQVVQWVLGRLQRVRGVLLAVDATGVGRPVVDELRDRLGPLIAVTITGGREVVGDGHEWHVPKRDLVESLLLAMQQERWQASRHLQLADRLHDELTAFSRKVSPAGHDRYEAGRDGEHDDLVLAAGMAAWYAEAEFAARAEAAMTRVLAEQLNRRAGVRISPY